MLDININKIKQIIYTALHQSGLSNEDKLEVINDLNNYFKRKQTKELTIKKGDMINGKIVDEVIYNEKLQCYHIFFNYSEFIGIEDVKSYISKEDLDNMKISSNDKVIKIGNCRKY